MFYLYYWKFILRIIYCFGKYFIENKVYLRFRLLIFRILLVFICSRDMNSYLYIGVSINYLIKFFGLVMFKYLDIEIYVI